MNNLQVFIYSGEQLRTVTKDNELWWVLRDVCNVLGLSNPARVAQRLDEDEKAEITLSYTSSNGVEQARNTTIINEPGLYAVILRSDKPEAKAFKRWVTHDVLPSIRKTGCYSHGLTEKQAADLAQAQKNLDSWHELRLVYDNSTALACKAASAARAHYDNMRARRDECRRHEEASQNILNQFISLLLNEEEAR